MTPDTNMLVRVVVLDHPDQTSRAKAELRAADTLYLTLPALCEFCWVLRSRYRYSTNQLVEAITALIEAENVTVDEGAVDAGLSMLRAGGDFADAVIAHQGAREGSRIFVSFDRSAVRLLSASGFSAREPA